MNTWSLPKSSIISPELEKEIIEVVDAVCGNDSEGLNDWQKKAFEKIQESDIRSHAAPLEVLRGDSSDLLVVSKILETAMKEEACPDNLFFVACEDKMWVIGKNSVETVSLEEMEKRPFGAMIEAAAKAGTNDSVHEALNINGVELTDKEINDIVLEENWREMLQPQKLSPHA